MRAVVVPLRPARFRPGHGPVLLLVAIALLACVPAASAATYYLSPSGSDSNSGLTPGSAWATLSKANGAVRGGDVVVMANGTYSGFPSPSNSGSAGARITYVGNLASPSSVTVSGGTLTRSYVTLKGMRFNGGASLGSSGSTVAQYDSIAFCQMSSFGLSGAKHCMIAHNRIDNVGGWAVAFLSSNGDQIPSGFANPEYDTLRANVITISRIPQDSRGMMFTSRMQFCVIDSNTVSGTFNGGSEAGRSYLFRFMHSFNNDINDNTFTVLAENRPGNQDWAMYCLRDSVHHMRFRRNRFTTTGSYPIEIFMSQSGDGTWSEDVKQNTWDGCFWDLRTPAASSYPGLYWQDGMSSDTLHYCVVKADLGPAAVIEGLRTGNLPSSQAVSVIDHCTFYGRADGSNAPLTVNIPSGSWPSGAGLKITNSIFYTNSTTSGSQYNTGYSIRVPRNRNFVSNNNLFAHYAGASKSVWYQIEGGSSGYSAPGSSGWLCQNGSSQGWGAGLECNSVYGSPQFEDSSRTTFDPRLRAASAARGVGTGGTDLGAMPYGLGGPDIIPPAQVTDLAAVVAGDQHMVLAWTAPGDDGMSGTPAAFDMRWSLSPITAVNFASATPMAVQPPTVAAGTQQNYVWLGLTAGTQYYVALRARDEAGNWSPVSNAVSQATAASDVLPPASVGDLRAD